MGPLRRVNPYYKGIKEESSLLFTVVSLNVFIYHIDVISSYFKASYQSFLSNGNCNYSFHLNISFIAVHSSDSFTLSFFLFSSCSAMARNCLGRQTTRVLFRPYLDVDVSTVCSTGLSLISLNSLDDVDNASEPTILSSSSLSEPEVKLFSQSLFLHSA